MAYQILPIWTGADGSDTGPIATTCSTMDEAGKEVRHWLSKPRPGLRVVVSDTVTWCRVATYRAKKTEKVVPCK